MKRLNDSKLFRVLVKVFSVILILGVFVSSLVLPSFAAESPGLPDESSITDLTFTTWVLNDSWYTGKAFGQFDVFWRVSSIQTSLFDSLFVGYQWVRPSSNTVLVESPNSISWTSTATSADNLNYVVRAPEVMTFTFLGGPDVSNPSLINWLRSVATLTNIYISSIDQPSVNYPPFMTNYQSISPIYFNDFSGSYSAVAFPGASTLTLASSSSSDFRDYLSESDFEAHPSRILFKQFQGSSVPYIRITLECHYASITLNGVSYSGVSSTSEVTSTLSGLTEFVCYPVSSTYSTGYLYYYNFDILLGNYINYDDLYDVAYNDGINSSAARDKWSQFGYDQGFIDGENASGSESLGQNLLGDTLSAPMRALNNFTLYRSSSGFEVTLGGVVGAAISLTLFIAFLKIFAGG